MDLLDELLKVEKLAKDLQVQNASRELALVITKIQEARLWEMERLSSQNV